MPAKKFTTFEDKQTEIKAKNISGLQKLHNEGT